MEKTENHEPVEITRVERIEHAIEHEIAQVEHAPNNRAIVEILSTAENLVLTAVAVVLIVLAAMLLINGAVLLVNAVVTGSLHDHVLDVLDTILLVAVVMEIVYTVTLSLRSHELAAEPFLVVGMIAAIRRILEITIKIGTATVAVTPGTAVVAAPGAIAPAGSNPIAAAATLATNAAANVAANADSAIVSSLLAELALLALIVIALAAATFLIRRSQSFVIKLPSQAVSVH